MPTAAAGQIVLAKPEIFGTGWVFMRGFGCLPLMAAVGFGLWLKWEWWIWVIVVLVAWVLGGSLKRAFCKTAVDDVVRHAMKDPAFYDQLLLNRILRVEAKMEAGQ
ncbi:MAG TPA: hypothetical protein PK490_19300 [Prosthecobacter sp.]|nr:hypothetical protein [Prosthecobacter sp.]HRK16436.1 hypothetical protein [Prosthecobacter sp.]